MTITRRFFLLASAAALPLLGSVFTPAQAQADRSAEASRFVQEFGDQMVAIVNAGESLPQKQAQMRPLIDRDLAIDDIGAFVLGRYWRLASPDQQARFVALFHSVVIKTIVDNLGEFRGVTYQMTQTTQRDGDYYVGTLIKRPNQQPNTAQWVVSFESGRPRIVDVVAEGTSLRLTRRSDYASFLARNSNNIDALLAALQKQVG